jgi:hypothetical protein
VFAAHPDSTVHRVKVMRIERGIRFMRLTPCWGGWLAQFELAMS